MPPRATTPTTRADRVARCSVLILLALGSSAAAARAQGLSGRFDVQFQSADRLIGNAADTTFRRATQQFWLQTYELTQTARFGVATNLFAQLRLTDLSYVGSDVSSRTPYGTLRIANPAFGFSGWHRPTITKTTIGDTSGATQVTARNEETALTGYLALHRMPRVDGSWIRRRLGEYAGLPGSMGTTRTLRAWQDFGPLSTHAGFSELAREGLGAVTSKSTQRTWDAGAALQALQSVRAGLRLEYTVANSQPSLERLPGQSTTSQDATVSGIFRQSPWLDWNLDYRFSGTRLVNTTVSWLDHHEGTFLGRYHPNPVAQLTAGGGIRSEPASTGYELLRYATATASMEGVPRQGLHALASATHTTNWSRVESTFSIDQLRGWTRMLLRQGMDVAVDVQVASNGDTALRDTRISSQAGVLGTLVPLQHFMLTLGARILRAGPDVGRASERTETGTADLRWQPFRGLEVSGTRSTSTLIQTSARRTTTSQATVTVTPNPSLKLWGSYARSDEFRQSVVADVLPPGREVVSARIIAVPAPRWSLSAGGTVVEPHRRLETRQFDTSVTWRFGR